MMRKMKCPILGLALALFSLELAGCATPSPVTLAPSLTSTNTVMPGATPKPTDTLVAMPSPPFTPISSASLVPTPIPHPTQTVMPASTVVPAKIRSFETMPAEINPGESFTMNWRTAGANAILCPPGGFPTVYQLEFGNCEDVPLTGTRLITVPDVIRGQSIEYRLYVSGPSGTTHELTVTLTATASITIKCPDNWFFSNPPAACPMAPALTSLAAAQHFEHGLMIWLQVSGRIFILYGTPSRPSVTVNGFSLSSEEYPDLWKTGLPESEPNIVPPPGYYQPIRGFGMVWRGESSKREGIPSVREGLGWALEPEFGFKGAYQCDAALRYPDCYLRGPDGDVIVLPYGGGWHVWNGPTNHTP